MTSNNLEHLAVDVPQDASYLEYWGAFEAIGKINALGAKGGRIGSIAAHITTAPLVPLELSGLVGQAAGSIAKDQSIFLEDVPKQPLLGNEHLGPISGKAISSGLGLPEMSFPGFNYFNHRTDINW